MPKATCQAHRDSPNGSHGSRITAKRRQSAASGRSILPTPELQGIAPNEQEAEVAQKQRRCSMSLDVAQATSASSMTGLEKANSRIILSRQGCNGSLIASFQMRVSISLEQVESAKQNTQSPEGTDQPEGIARIPVTPTMMIVGRSILFDLFVPFFRGRLRWAKYASVPTCLPPVPVSVSR
jgi:hypothetical protein